MVAMGASEGGNRVRSVPASEVQPSPENDEIYGVIDLEDSDLIDLANDIINAGIREPLRVSEDGFIVSGHRRYAAAGLAKLTTVPVVVLDIRRDDHDSVGWKKVLRSFNHQRVKSPAVRMREAMLGIDADIAHRQLVEQRDERKRKMPPEIVITGQKVRSEISDRKIAFLHAAIGVVNSLRNYWPVSVRQVHYGLLNDPPLRNSSTGSQRARYQNDQKSYKDLCNLLTRARLKGIIPRAAIADETRPTTGKRFWIDSATFASAHVDDLFRGFRRDLMQSQTDHIELIAEKLTVQNIIHPVANKFCIPMTVGRGYCSIEPRFDIVDRFKQSAKDRLVLLIASDFDPDGEEIAESLARSLRDDFDLDPEQLQATKILLRPDQIKNWSLPPNEMEAKSSSAQYKKFVQRHGSSAVYELEAVQPQQMQKAVTEAVESVIDVAAFNKEVRQESRDAVRLQVMKSEAAEWFSDMVQNEEGDDDFWFCVM